MDGLYRLAPSDQQFTIGDRTYTLSKSMSVLEAFAEVEAHLIASRVNPLGLVADVLEKFPAGAQEKLLQLALDKVTQLNKGLAPDEITDFLETFEGVCLMFWIAIRGQHPEIDTLAKAKRLVIQAGEEGFEQLKRRIDAAAGYQHLGNSSGQTREAENAAAASSGAASTAT